MDKTLKKLLTALTFFLAVEITIAAVLVWRLQVPVRGDFIPPEFDRNAVAGSPVIPEESMQYTEVDVAGNFRVDLCANARLGDNTLYVYFASPAENGVWLKLRVQDEAGNVLGESGIIRPGEYLPSVLLMHAPQEGKTLTVKVISYEPKTYYSMGVAPITIRFSSEE